MKTGRKKLLSRVLVLALVMVLTLGTLIIGIAAIINVLIVSAIF